MWLLTGIFIYLAIGYIFVYLSSAYEDGFWDQVKIILFWPILWIMLVVCYIVFIFIGRSNIKRRSMIKVTKEIIKEFVDNNCHNCKAYPVCGAELVCCPDWDKFIEDKNKDN